MNNLIKQVGDMLVKFASNEIVGFIKRNGESIG
jgi:hypothetical protein